MHAQSQTSLASFLDATPVKNLIGIPQEDLDQIMALAYQLYQAERYGEAEVLCRGLIAADHRYWWCYSLYAALLRKQGRLREALDLLERGLRYEPGQAKLVAMRDEIVRFLAALSAAVRTRKGAEGPTTVNPATAVAQPEVRS